jgi:hypothetical protein
MVHGQPYEEFQKILHIPGLITHHRNLQTWQHLAMPLKQIDFHIMSSQEGFPPKLSFFELHGRILKHCEVGV